MALASIGQDVHNLSKKLGLSADLQLLEHAWDHEVGGFKDLARIAAIDQGSLVIETDSAPVMQEISLRRRELTRKLNKHLRTPFIRHITVRVRRDDGR